jgi:hypothetical protein
MEPEPATAAQDTVLDAAAGSDSQRRRTQPWKYYYDISHTPKTWEQMPYKMIDELEIRLVDIYHARKTPGDGK